MALKRRVGRAITKPTKENDKNQMMGVTKFCPLLRLLNGSDWLVV